MNDISYIVSYFTSQGVPLETVTLLLMLPVVATLIALLQQVVGIKAFGIYTPLIITFSFFFTGLKYGIAIFVTVIIIGMAARVLLKKVRILYLPRVAINLSIVALAMLALLALGGDFQRTGLAAVSIFPLLIMITIVEKFVATQIEKGTKTAVRFAAETMIISIIGFGLLSWPTLVNFVVANAWVILLTIPINIAIGKWTGLRFSEYLRFREVIKRS